MSVAAMVEGKKKTRRVQILEFICEFAAENGGNSPSLRTIARNLDMGVTTVRHHLDTLRREGRLRWTEEQRLWVVNSQWEPPPDMKIQRVQK